MARPMVAGRFVEAFLASAGDVSPVFERKARSYLEAYGIEDVDGEQWYPMQDFADAMNDIEDTVGEMTSRQAGIKMIAIVDELSDLPSMDAAIEVGKRQHQQSYQNFTPDAVGQLRHESLDGGDSRVAYYGGWPYPRGFTEGIFRGFAKSTHHGSAFDIEPTAERADEEYAFVVSF